MTPLKPDIKDRTPPGKSAEKTYRIKPLVWTNAKHDTDAGRRISADSTLGTYVVSDAEWCGDVFGRPAEGESARWEYCLAEYYDEGRFDAESFDAAKAAAESHYRSRLLTALEECP